jgi:hypothetical protein
MGAAGLGAACRLKKTRLEGVCGAVWCVLWWWCVWGGGGGRSVEWRPGSRCCLWWGWGAARVGAIVHVGQGWGGMEWGSCCFKVKMCGVGGVVYRFEVGVQLVKGKAGVQLVKGNYAF